MSKLGFWSKWMNREEIFAQPAKYTPVMGLPNGPNPREEPATINLHRAVLDEAPKVIGKIDRDIKEMDSRKIELTRQREIYVDMLAAAQKHATPRESNQ
jgi:hypothetical protein